MEKEGKKECKKDIDVPIETLMAMRFKKMTQAQIAEKTGLSQQTISRRLSECKLDGLEDFKNYRADVFSHKQRELLDALTPEKIASMSGRDLIISLGVLYDKERLERNKATHIIDYGKVKNEIEELEKEIYAYEAMHKLKEQKRISSGEN